MVHVFRISPNAQEASGVQNIFNLLHTMQLNEMGTLINTQVSDLNTPNEICNAMAQDMPFSLALLENHQLAQHIYRGLVQRVPGAGMLVFDAHADVLNNIGPRGWLAKLIAEGILDPSRVVVVGCRMFDQESFKFMTQHTIKHFTMREISFDGINIVCDAAMSVCRMWPALQISIDMNVIDPAFAPGTLDQVPGGISAREMIYFAQRIKNLRNAALVDLTGVDPGASAQGLTCQLAAKIMAELVSQ